jgi:hypothetical protein
MLSVGLMSSMGLNALVLPLSSLALLCKVGVEDSRTKSEVLTACACRLRMFC